MRVLFFWMNLGCPVGISVGVGILSRELEEAGIGVKVIHLNEEVGYPYDEDRIAADAADFLPDLFGISFGGNHVRQAKRLAGFLRGEFPGIKTICGGVQATLTSEEVLSWPGVDYVCRGEADGGRFVNFVKVLSEGGDTRRLQSFWAKGEDGKIYENPIGPLPDISEQARLSFEAFDLEKIIRLNRGFAETLVGRGCPHRCAYCHNGAIISLYKNRMEGGFRVSSYCRHRNVDNIIGELKEFTRRYPQIKAFILADDVLVSDMEWFRDFARRYGAEVGLPFVSNASVRQIDAEVAGLLKTAGCNMIKFGIECGSERIRNEILKKKVPTKRLFEAVGILQGHDINIRGYVMLGNPTETIEDMLETYKMCADLRLDTTRTAIMYPYPGTEIYDFCRERDLLDESISPPSYLTHSVLKWDAETGLFLKKSVAINQWIMNVYLDNEASPEYKKLADRVFGMSADEWDDPQVIPWIREQSVLMSRKFRELKVPHYFNPLSDRPDVAYLMKERKNRIINVDDF
ncbi:MAG: radical SAM protein [bacterium]